MGSVFVQLEKETPPPAFSDHARRDLSLLCLDGGGVRGLLSLFILQRILAESAPGVVDPRPCHYFDMIGGTSTGGLIAIMLGRLRMSILECINVYISLAGEVFGKRKSRFAFSALGKVKARYDSEVLERAIVQVLRNKHMSEDQPLINYDESEYHCPTFVCATPKGVSADTKVLRSYRSKVGIMDLQRSVKIWEAARATCAATSYFDEIKIGPLQQSFLDGGFNANNPVEVLWNEAKMHFCPSGRLEDRLSCVVSIGTGVDPVRDMGSKVWGVGRSLVKIATETEQTARKFQNNHDDLYRNGRYFRFNVDSLGHIGMDEAKKSNLIAQETDYYLRKPSVVLEVERCGQALDGPNSFD